MTCADSDTFGPSYENNQSIHKSFKLWIDSIHKPMKLYKNMFKCEYNKDIDYNKL